MTLELVVAQAVLFIVWLFLSLIAHELGHVMLARHYGSKARLIIKGLDWRTEYDAKVLTKEQEINVLSAGIVFGGLTVAASAFILNAWLVLALLILQYRGSRYDISRIRALEDT